MLLSSETKLDTYIAERNQRLAPEDRAAAQEAVVTTYIAEESPSDLSVSLRARLVGLAALSAIVYPLIEK